MYKVVVEHQKVVWSRIFREDFTHKDYNNNLTLVENCLRRANIDAVTMTEVCYQKQFKYEGNNHADL